MEAVRIIIADDHKIIRIGLRGILEREAGVEITGEADDGNQLMDVLATTAADVVLMDIDMGRTNGIDMTRKLGELYPAINVLALTMHEEEDHIISMLEAGAKGYLLKNAGPDELLTAIFTVAKGDSYFSNQVSATLLKAITTLKNRPSEKKTADSPLTERETEVLRLIAREYSNSRIAEQLFISIRTVDTHRRNLMDKLHIHNTAGLVKYAIEKDLV